MCGVVTGMVGVWLGLHVSSLIILLIQEIIHSCVYLFIVSLLMNDFCLFALLNCLVFILFMTHSLCMFSFIHECIYLIIYTLSLLTLYTNTFICSFTVSFIGSVVYIFHVYAACRNILRMYKHMISLKVSLACNI